MFVDFHFIQPTRTEWERNIFWEKNNSDCFLGGKKHLKKIIIIFFKYLQFFSSWDKLVLGGKKSDGSNNI